MNPVRILGLVAMAVMALACGGEEDTGGTKQAGEACDTDSECANGSCVVDADGNKACADAATDDGGW